MTTVHRWTSCVSAFVAVILVAAPTRVSAHPVPFTFLDVHLEPNALTVTLVAHIFDLAHDLDLMPVDELLKSDVVASRANEMESILAPRFTLAANGQMVAGTWSSPPEILSERQSIRFQRRYELPGPTGTVRVTAAMFPYDPNHQTFVNVYDGETLTQAILDRSRPTFEYFAGTRQGVAAVIRRLVPSGVRQVLTGPDHLLFLIGLLLLGGSIRQLVLVVASFTLSYSVALSLATFNIVTPPVRLVAPAVALSVVYVGADNLLAGGGRDVRAWVALFFGFIHGLGVANVLREMDLPRRALGWALMSFNFGIEIAQLVVVVAVVWGLASIRARSERAGRRVVFAGSIAVIAVGVFYFVRRVFFPMGII